MRISSLDQLGWSAFHSSQLTLEDLERGFPARVTAVHRGDIEVLDDRGGTNAIVTAGLYATAEAPPIAVGDWLLLEHESRRTLRVLERRSIIARLSAGSVSREQPIAANVDTLFIVTSCNQDFNPSRLERYLAVAHQAAVTPVIVLTKADQCLDSASYVGRASALSAGVEVIALNATSSDAREVLAPWLARGQTVAFVGSSGVGKSTLTNTLLGDTTQAIAGIREDDARGRHTTTARQMFALPGLAWVIDTPGMRELKVGDVDEGLAITFRDVDELALGCRFRDCDHRRSQGCALRAAVESGALDERRLENYLKLQRESAWAMRTAQEQRELERSWGRVHRNAQKLQRKLRGREE